MHCPFQNREEVLQCVQLYPLGRYEDQMMALTDCVSHREPRRITLDELIIAAKWKWRGGRTWHLCANNAPDEVEEISAAAFAQQHDWVRIAALTTLEGVGWPMASVILHFAFRRTDDYPILDVNALTAVGGIAPNDGPPHYTGRLWGDYVR